MQETALPPLTGSTQVWIPALGQISSYSAAEAKTSFIDTSDLLLDSPPANTQILLLNHSSALSVINNFSETNTGVSLSKILQSATAPSQLTPIESSAATSIIISTSSSQQTKSRTSAAATAGAAIGRNKSTATLEGLKTLGPVQILLPLLQLGVPPPDKNSTYVLPPPYDSVRIRIPAGAWPNVAAAYATSRRENDESALIGEQLTATVFALQASDSVLPGEACGAGLDLGPQGLVLSLPIAISVPCNLSKREANASAFVGVYAYGQGGWHLLQPAKEDGDEDGDGILWATTQTLTANAGFLVPPVSSSTEVGKNTVGVLASVAAGVACLGLLGWFARRRGICCSVGKSGGSAERFKILYAPRSTRVEPVDDQVVAESSVSAQVDSEGGDCTSSGDRDPSEQFLCITSGGMPGSRYSVPVRPAGGWELPLNSPLLRLKCLPPPLSWPALPPSTSRPLGFVAAASSGPTTSSPSRVAWDDSSDCECCKNVPAGVDDLNVEDASGGTLMIAHSQARSGAQYSPWQHDDFLACIGTQAPALRRAGYRLPARLIPTPAAAAVPAGADRTAARFKAQQCQPESDLAS